jgi:hypothetical protein
MSMRSVLPNRRASETFEVRHLGQRVIVTTGFYSNGRIGEAFVSAPKVGSNMEAIARDAAVLLSIAIQHGVPLSTMQHALTREQDGSPSTIIGAVVDRIIKMSKEEP